MSKKDFLFTSESVTEGHPDKLADQISDAVLDSIMEQDPMGRVACETSVTTGMVLCFGEITTNCYVDIPRIVRETVEGIGYIRAKYGFDHESCAVLTSIDRQSCDIAMGVDQALESKTGEQAENAIDEIGAGDQGMMFGYATDATPEMMPLPITLAHKMSKRLAEERKNCNIDYLRPDGKTQVTVHYENGIAKAIKTVVISAQHHPEVLWDQIRHDLIEKVAKPVIPPDLMSDDIEYFINPTGRFVIGGPHGDAGLTGRKIIVDTYGGWARHGGGAFSGKDPTKVDRSASYAARHVAKNIVAAGIAKHCEVQLAYAIGVAHPVSIMVDTFESGVISDEAIVKLVRESFDLRPAGIIRDLDLRRPIYKQTAAYGHFGRLDLDLPWERIDRVDILRKSAGLA